MATQGDTQPSLISRLAFFGKRKANDIDAPARESNGEDERTSHGPPKWSFGVLNDKNTIEVPGRVSHSTHPRPALTFSRLCFITCGPQE